MEHSGSKIIVGVDGSPNAVSALAWAIGEARDRQVTVEAVYVYQIPAMAYSAPGFMPPGEAEIETLGQKILEDALSVVNPGDVKVLLRVVEASPVEALVSVAGDPDVATVVVGARGHGGVMGLLLGSVSHALTHRCSKPLVVVPHEWSAGPARRIVVGVDGSQASARALAWAVQDARATGSTVDAVMVWSSHVPEGGPSGAGQLGEVAPALRRVVDTVEHHGVTVEARLVSGRPAPTLLEESESARLLVVGTRGIGRAHEMLSGSVSHACVHRSQIPVVVVPPGH